MSKDIRSFFSVKASTGIQKKTSPVVADKKINNRKRALLVISDSESDEEKKDTSIVKRHKPSVTVPDKKPTSTKKNEELNTSSKYFTSKNVDATTIFGSRLVQRNNSRNIIKKTEAKSEECHIDKEFEAELLKLDGLDTDVLPLEEKILENKNANETYKHSDCNGSEETSNDNKRFKRSHEDDLCGNFKESEPKKVNGTPPKSLQKEISPKTVEGTPPKSLQKEISPKKVKGTPPKSLQKEISPKKKKDVTPKKHPSSNYSVEISKSVGSNCNDTSDATQKSNAVNNTVKNEPLNNKPANAEVKLSKSYNNKIISTDKLPIKTAPLREKCLENKDQREACTLWVDKYKPTTTKQIIGQQGEKSCVNKLVFWLKNWHKNNSDSKKQNKPNPWAKNDTGATFKAALLSGPPGVGKTTTAHIVSKELGFDVVEFNASDTRSKKLLHQEVSELLSTNSLTPFFTGNESKAGVTKQHVLLMDEVDGMAGNEDRGGVQELIALIRQSKVPIICMCNDRNHPKIRSLANYCFDLRFHKPRVEQIRGAMMSICFKENFKIKPDALNDIITSANQDLRLIVNHLSMLAIDKTDLTKSKKHIKLGPWDIVRKIFSEEEHKTMSIYDKCDLFFHDYSVTPLFVQENYLNVVPHKNIGKDKIKKIQLFAAAARSLSLGDLVERSIRSHNAWGLLPVQAIFSSYAPGEILEGHVGGQINFPAWFGKNSRQTKMNRLLQDITIHSRLKISGSKEAMNLDYITPLEQSIVSPLVRLGSNGIEQSLAVLAEYCLVREDLESLSELSTWPNSRNLFSEVETKVKAAFTRAYNKTSTPTPYAAVPIKKGSKTDFIDSVTGEEEEENIVDDDEDEKDDELEVDAMIVKKKPQVSKSEKEAGRSSTKGSKNSKRGRKK